MATHPSIKIKSLSRVRLSATPWTVAHQAPLSMGFSRQECQRGLPCPPLGDLPDPGIKHGSPALQADSLPSEPPEKPTKPVSFQKTCSPYRQGCLETMGLALSYSNCMAGVREPKRISYITNTNAGAFLSQDFYFSSLNFQSTIKSLTFTSSLQIFMVHFQVKQFRIK